MKPLKTKVSITLDNDLVDQLKQFAEDDDRSFSQYVNRILKQYVEDTNAGKEKKRIDNHGNG